MGMRGCFGSSAGRRLAAAAAVGAALSAAPAADAQRLDVREDPSICSAALSSSCLDSLGAGAVAAPEKAKPGSRVCAEQLAIYAACLSYASGDAGAASGAPQSGGVGGSLPLKVTGVLTPNKRDVYAFAHDGGRVSVTASETSSAAYVSLRKKKGVELVKRTCKIGGGERNFTQCLPAGEYQLSIQGRSKGTPYRVVVSDIGDC